MKTVTALALLAALLFMIYPPLDNQAQTKPAYIYPVQPIKQPSASVEKARDVSDSLTKEFLDKAWERDRKIDQLIANAKKLEVENALLKRRLRIGALTQAKTTNTEKKNILTSTVRTSVTKDTVFVTNIETEPCPDTIMIPVKRRSLWNRIFN